MIERREDSASRASWLRAIRQARRGDLDRLIFLLCVPQNEIGTERRDARGARVVRHEFLSLPDDPWLRGLIVSALLRGRRGPRGRPAKADPIAAHLVRLQHAENRRQGLSDKESRKRLFTFYGPAFSLEPGTLDDIIEARKTYAADYERHPKFTKQRLARKISR
jgi:hypothetical protein